MKTNRRVSAISNQGKHLARKEHKQRLLNKTFEWDKANLSVNELSIGPQPQIDKVFDKKALNKSRKGRASGTSGVVLDMLFASGDLNIEHKTSLLKQERYTM